MGVKREWPVGVRQASKSTLEISFIFRGVRCREPFKLAPTPANIKRLALHRAAILDSIARGVFDYAVTFPNSPRRFQFSDKPSDGYKLELYLESWLAKSESNYKSSTYDDYRKIIENTIIPELGSINLPDVSIGHIKRMCEKIDASNKRLSNIQSVLSTALDDAVTDELITLNPLKQWRYKKAEVKLNVEDEDYDVDPFTKEEQQLILDACRHPSYRNLFQFAFWSGLRTSEIVALLWTDIDFKQGTIFVNKAKTQAAKEAEKPKTKQSRRYVKMLPPAREALENQLKLTSEYTHVFINPRTSEPFAGDQPVRRCAWNWAIKDSGVRYRNPYQTRHTYASMMLTAGENPTWIAGQMGHADIGMINRNYGRYVRDSNPDAGMAGVSMFAQRVELTEN
jgi:integrase